MTAPRYPVASLAPEHTPALTELFARCGSACYCRYWHFAGDKNAWLERCAQRPEDNRRELVQAIDSGSIEARGLVAFEAAAPSATARIVGWMKLAPAPTLPKLTKQRPYVGLGGVEREREDCYVIGCMLVDPAFRRRGVGRALVGAAPDFARGWGARALQAFPYRAESAPPELLWKGPAELLIEHGFRELSSVGPYPVLRLDL